MEYINIRNDLFDQDKKGMANMKYINISEDNVRRNQKRKKYMRGCAKNYIRSCTQSSHLMN